MYCFSALGYLSVSSFESWQHFSPFAASFFEQASCHVRMNSICFGSLAVAFCAGVDCAWAFRGLSVIVHVSIASAVIRITFFMMSRSSTVFFGDFPHVVGAGKLVGAPRLVI